MTAERGARQFDSVMGPPCPPGPYRGPVGDERPDQTLAGAVSWAGDMLGAEITAVRPVTGGMSAGLVRLETTTGTYALRWWQQPGDWPTMCLVRQRAVLEALADTGLPVPRSVACDPRVPAGLTTWCPGEIDLDPTDPDRWLASMADTLAAIHATAAPDGLPRSLFAGSADDFLPRVVADLADAEAGPDLDWLGDPGVATDVRTLVAAGSTDPPVLLHGDYQHFNIVWTDGRLTGVIDWAFGGLGDRGIDVGHCRLNLTVLFGPELAMSFLDRYEASAGVRVSPAADVRRLLGYSADWPLFIPRQVAGRRPVDGPGMAGRVRATLVETLRRAG